MTQDVQTRPAISTAQPEDFFQLLKPRVMSVVVFTAATGLVMAPGSMNPLVAAIAILCIAVGAGAAGSLNMALEGETDALMRRTRGRPVSSHTCISSRSSSHQCQGHSPAFVSCAAGSTQ